MNAYKCNDYCYAGGKDTCICDTLLHTVIISCSESLCRNDRKSLQQSHQKTKNQEHNGSCRTNRRKCGHSDKSSHNNRICHIIKLLKNISDNKRCHKFQNQHRRIPLRHIYFLFLRNSQNISAPLLCLLLF